VIGQILQRGVRFFGGGHIDECQHDAGNQLQREAEKRRTAKDIEPTSSTLRNMVAYGGFPEFFDMQAVVYPIEHAKAEIGKFLNGNLHALG
jgi:hypothetical protein